MKPKKIGTMQVLDAQTGDVISEQRNAFTMLPPSGDVCQACGTDHAWNQPHNQQSLCYQMQFHATHGRYPTWSDAMAHCAPETQAPWRTHLVEGMRAMGMQVPLDLLDVGPTAGR